jgi:signal transduction histidine kinase
LCRAGQIKYQVELPENPKGLTMTEEVRRSIYLIFKEALTNAVRHAGASFIKVTFLVRGGEFALSVEDDGKGMASSQQSTTQSKRGHGLRNMAKRAEEIQASLIIEGAKPSGTVIRLTGRMTQLGH